MGDYRDRSCAKRDEHDVAARCPDQRLNHRVEQSDVGQNAEEDNGKDEHHHDLHHPVEAFEIEV